jgi:hypothetical protein
MMPGPAAMNVSANRMKSTGAPRLVRGPNASSNRSNPATGKAELALRGKPYKD